MSQLARLGRVKKVGWRSAYTHVEHNSMCALRSSMRFAEITHLQAFHLALASPCPSWADFDMLCMPVILKPHAPPIRIP